MLFRSVGERLTLIQIAHNALVRRALRTRQSDHLRRQRRWDAYDAVEISNEVVSRVNRGVLVFAL
jgi:hypothetical protein